MRNQSRWTGMVVGVVMGVLFSAAVVLAGNLEPGEGANQAVSQGNPSIYLPIILKAGGSSSASVPRTGQTISYGPLDDGALQKGVAWPNPRFTDNANGTVTDNLTGLIWLKDAKCTNFFSGDITGVNKRTWDKALIAANSLGSGNCSLTDGSAAGQWRLPNIKELYSLIDHGFFNPVLSNAVGTGKWSAGDPFNVHLDLGYWSSTTCADNIGNVWAVPLYDGNVSDASKTQSAYVWPVRGGQ